ncbi:HAD family hydrolase [Lihuaxuella thermophila]|uniref:Cof subfamily of IIB subfamily of haloacid dehalogenase superfamily/HAD-superfamily hydrolase, subfamily IIB n=1 Tax=Lihuaxuella thermophila TaxID=1173111 RepID=A0A1H8H5G6_9BACL|nr:HAD family hydrolase [Lihuaxuella thermophila]SEN51631.1 hypothetical protein SAMN05444955_11356 [Lihuaxuella thermophila]
MIKLFVSDLDNTLFNDEKQISEDDRRAIRALMDAGIHICLASGRMDKELVSVMEQLGGSFHRISQNGAFVYTREGERLLAASFEGNLARHLYEAAAPFGLVGFISMEDRMLVPSVTEDVRRIESRMMFPVEEHPGVLEEIGTTIQPSKICFIGDIGKIRQLETRVHQQFPGRVDTFISDRDCIDLMPPNISKGAGLKRLLDKLDLKPHETACIGDSYNDISMLQLTPHSFAMFHADPEVQKEARHTAKSVAEAAEWVLDYNAQAAMQA